MEKQQKRKILWGLIALVLGFLFGIIISSCAPAEKKVDTFKGDLPPATYQPEANKTIPKPEAYYSAADFGLPAGRVIDYSPTHDYLNNCSTEDGMKIPDIYIHIQPPGDGPIRVQKITYQVWLQLGKDAILK